MKISVIIPTYRRPEELRRCLEGLRKQARQADELIVVVRDGDGETRSFLNNLQFGDAGLRVATVSVPGQVAALNAGLDKAAGDIIAFTDDDAIPHPDWLARIEAHFQDDPKTGGVGGRDRVFIEGKEVSGVRFQVSGAGCKVGRIAWYGRITGNHHLGAGEVREVDHLKGSNMAFRKAAIAHIRFDERLHGQGAQYRNDLSVCLVVKRKGWKIIYDPHIGIDHYYATRFEDDKRGNFNWRAVEDGAHNETLVLMEYLSPLRRIGYVIFFTLMGNIFTPGLLQFIRILPREKGNAFLRLFAAYKGRWQGVMTWIRGKNEKI